MMQTSKPGKVAEAGLEAADIEESESSGAEKKCRDLGTFFDDWQRYSRQVVCLAPSTVERYGRRVAELLEAVDSPAELTAAHLEAQLSGLFHRGVGRTTLRVALAAARSFGDYLVIRQALERNPFRLVRGPKNYTKEAPVLTTHGKDRLIYGPVPGRLPEDPRLARDRVMLAVMYQCGLRVSEPGRLEIETVAHDPGEDVWSIRVDGAKWADRDERMPLYDPLTGKLFAAWVQVIRPRLLGGQASPWLFPSSRGGGPLAPGSVWRIFKREVKEAGIRKKGRRLSPHILRHTLATDLLERGADISLVRDWLRHADVSTTQRYLHRRLKRAGGLFRSNSYKQR